jgi:hypothetical protein
MVAGDAKFTFLICDSFVPDLSPIETTEIHNREQSILAPYLLISLQSTIDIAKQPLTTIHIETDF